MDGQRLFSLLLRDFTIIAKRHADLARDYRAVAGTCRHALDDTRLLADDPGSPGSDGKVGAPAISDPFRANLEKDYD